MPQPIQGHTPDDQGKASNLPEVPSPLSDLTIDLKITHLSPDKRFLALLEKSIGLFSQQDNLEATDTALKLQEQALQLVPQLKNNLNQKQLDLVHSLITTLQAEHCYLSAGRWGDVLVREAEKVFDPFDARLAQFYKTARAAYEHPEQDRALLKRIADIPSSTPELETALGNIGSELAQPKITVESKLEKLAALAAVYEEAGNLAQAEKLHEYSLELVPKKSARRVDVLGNYGLFLARSGEMEEAKAECYIALEMSKKFGDAFVVASARLGSVLIKDGDDRAGVRLIENALEQAEESFNNQRKLTDLKIFIAETYVEARQFVKAFSLVKEIEKLDHDRKSLTDLKLHVAEGLYEIGDGHTLYCTTDALDMARAVYGENNVKLAPFLVAYARARGHGEHEQSERDLIQAEHHLALAERLMEKASRSYTQDLINCLLLRSDTLELLGNDADALRCLNKTEALLQGEEDVLPNETKAENYIFLSNSYVGLDAIEDGLRCLKTAFALGDLSKHTMVYGATILTQTLVELKKYADSSENETSDKFKADPELYGTEEDEDEDDMGDSPEWMPSDLEAEIKSAVKLVDRIMPELAKSTLYATQETLAMLAHTAELCQISGIDELRGSRAKYLSHVAEINKRLGN